MLKIPKNNGFALPSAIFLLVILSVLSIAVLSVNTYSQKATVNDVLETKAYFIAKAGLAYGSRLTSQSGVCSSTPQTVLISEPGAIDFKFSFICTETTSEEAGIEQIYYKITSFACNSSNSTCPDASGKPSREDYVEKSLTLIVAK